MIFTVRSRRLKTVLVLSLLLSVMQSAHATPIWMFQGLVQTLNTGSSTLNSPSAMVVDPAGDVFVADTGNHQIVEVNAYGTASVLSISGLSPALVSPTGIAIDGSGNLYITDADPSNSRVVKVSPSEAGSVVSTGAVTLGSPKGVAIDQSGNIFIADSGHNQIVEVPSGGSASVLAISGLTSPSTLNTPMGLAVDTVGNLYIADSVNNRVVKVAAGGTAGTVVSTGELDPALNVPSGVAVDRIGNIYIASTGSNNIAEVDGSGSATWLLSSSQYMQTFSLSGPLGVALDVFGTLYVADSGAVTDHNRVLIVDRATTWSSDLPAQYTSSLNKSAVGFGHVQLGASTGVTLTLPFVPEASFSATTPFKVFTSGVQNKDFTVVAGGSTNCSSASSGSGCTIEIQFLPTAPGLRHGAVVLYDSGNNPIITVPLYGFGDASVVALAPNTGTVISTGGVPLSFPFQIALDGAGTIYDANDGGTLVKIPAGGGTASVVSPSGYTFSSEVTGVAIDGAGNLFISDHLNHRIIVITPGSVASVLSISGLAPALGFPTALAFDAAGNLYISDYQNGRVVEVSCVLVAGSTSKGIGTVIGTKGYTTSSTGITGVAVDSMANIYIPDGYAGNDPSRIIKVTAAGAASLLTATGITFSRPEGVTADSMDNLYIADGGHNRIVKISTAGVTSVLTLNGLPSPTSLGSPFGITVDSFGNLYIPDSGNNRVLFSNVSGSTLAFPSTATGATSAAKTATATNQGNQPLVFSTNPTYTADFSNYSSDVNPCTSSTSLLAGTACDVAVVFTPQSVGSLSAGITLTDNTLNVPGSTQQIAVSGTAFSGADATSTTVTVTPTPLTNGQAAGITATVADLPHSGTHPTGSVTFNDTLGTTITTLSSASLSSGAATLSGVVLHGIGTHTLSASYAGVSGSYAASSGTVTVVLSKAVVTVSGPTPPIAVAYGQPGSVTITVAGPYATIAAPTGTISYSILSSLGAGVASGTPALSAGSTGSTATIPIPNTLAAGSYTISVTYGGDGNYSLTSTAASILFTVGQATPTIALTSAANPVMVTNVVTFTANVASSAGTPTGTVTFIDGTTSLGAVALSNGTAAFSTSSLAAGTHAITAVYAGNITFASVTSNPVIEVIQGAGQATPTIALTSTANPAMVTSSVTFTANVTSSAGTPTGMVTFLDGTTPLGAVALSNGAAVFTTSSLAAGTHTITAAYAGNINFTSVTSIPVVEVIQDFSLSPPSGSPGTPTQTVLPGGTATYSLVFGPLSGTTFPNPVTLSVTGLPPGATATLTPNTLPAGSSLTNVTLTIQLPQTTARQFDQRLPMVVWSLLLLPFAGRLRRARKRMPRVWAGLLVVAAALAAGAGVSGCASTSSGFFGHAQQAYSVVITATSGSISHSTTVALIVQ